MTSILWKDEPNVTGGIYETINVEGDIIADASIEANEIVISKEGKLKVEGQLNVPYLKVSGELIIEGTLETNELSISDTGYLVVKGDVIADHIGNKGTIDLKQGLKANEIKNNGAFIGLGPVKAESFHSKGSLRLDDELNAKEIAITVAEVSNIRYIIAEDLVVKAEREKLIFKDEASQLTSREIDVVHANVENLVCELLRADDVAIHENCSIKAVEYVNAYDYNESSDVLEFSKITRD